MIWRILSTINLYAIRVYVNFVRVEIGVEVNSYLTWRSQSYARIPSLVVFHELTELSLKGVDEGVDKPKKNLKVIFGGYFFPWLFRFFHALVFPTALALVGVCMPT